MQERQEGPREENRTDASDQKTTEAVEITDENTLDPIGEIGTTDGVFVMGGGKLPGNNDDLSAELDSRPHPVPGADPNNGVVAPNERDLRQ
jgi:hypothetical protein